MIHLPIIYLPDITTPNTLQKSLIIHEQNTKKIIAVNEYLYVAKHTWIFTKLLPRFSGLYNIYIENSFVNKLDKMGIKWISSHLKYSSAISVARSLVVRKLHKHGKGISPIPVGGPLLLPYRQRHPQSQALLRADRSSSAKQQNRKLG